MTIMSMVTLMTLMTLMTMMTLITLMKMMTLMIMMKSGYNLHCHKSSLVIKAKEVKIVKEVIRGDGL